MAVGGGKRRRLWTRPEAVEVGAGVDDLGPAAPAGDFDLDLWRDFDLAFFPLAPLVGWCLAASWAAASAAALSWSMVGTSPAWRVSIQNCPRAVLWPDPLRRPSFLWVFLVLDICIAKLKSFSLFLMYSLYDATDQFLVLKAL